jgi:ABC-type bacteriocin/lantibiotic exporter with double-glycine peptidase domain
MKERGAWNMRALTRGLWVGVALAVTLALARCDQSPPATPPPSHTIRGVPLADYRANWCGPAALAAVLQFYGVSVTAADIAKEIYLPGYRGTLNLDLLLYARKAGFDVWAGEGDAEKVKKAVARGRPVICMVRSRGRVVDRNHFVVIRGYDSLRRTWLLDDGTGKEVARRMLDFEKDWRDCGHWMLVVEGRKPTPAETGKP